MAESIRGNKTLSGTWGELWIDGEKIFEFSKIELKVTANREDVQIGIDVDSKITGLKGEGSYTVKKVYTRAKAILESWKKGKDVRCQIIAKLKDPDAVNGQTERWSANNVWHNELPVVNWEKGGIVEEETSIGFTPSDLQNLDQIAAYEEETVMDKDKSEVFKSFTNKAIKRFQEKKVRKYRTLHIPSLDENIKIRNLDYPEIVECTEIEDENDPNAADKYTIYLAVVEPNLKEVAQEMMNQGLIQTYPEVVNIFEMSEITEIATEIMKLSGVLGNKKVTVVEELKNS